MTVELIHVHIPRTAGTTLAELLRSIYGEDRVISLLPPPSRRTGPLDIFIHDQYSTWFTDRTAFSEDWFAHVRPHEQAILREYKALVGHTPVELYDGMFSGVPRITTIRDPVSLQISWYLWDIRHPNMGIVGVPFEDVIEMPYRRNVQTMMTGGDLDQFAYVGVFDFVQANLEDLRKMFGWDGLGFEPKHLFVGSGRQYDRLLREIVNNQALLERVRRLNSDDDELYRQAVARRMERLGGRSSSYTFD